MRLRSSACSLGTVTVALLLLQVPVTTPAAAVTRSCTADKYYAAGVLRQEGGPTIQIRAYFPGSVTASDTGVAPEPTRRRACRSAVSQGLRNLHASVNQRAIEDALCTRSVRADGSNAPLPRGDGVYVRASSLVVETSREPDIHTMDGLGGLEISCGSAQNNAFGADGAFCNDFLKVINPFRNIFNQLHCVSATVRGGPPAASRPGQEWFDYCIARGRGAATELARTMARKADECLVRKHAALVDARDPNNVEAYCRRYAEYYPAFNTYQNQLSALLWGWPGGPRRDARAVCTILRPDQRRRITQEQSYQACMANRDHASLQRGATPSLLHRVAGTLSTSCGSNQTSPRCRPSYTYLASIINTDRNCLPHIQLGGTWLFPPSVQNP